MKRTFTVTVEGEDARKRWFDPDTIKEHIEGWTDTTVTVTETTAVHHAERMVINRALIWDAPGFSEKRTPKLQQAVRELRTLMEGTPNG